MERRNWRKGAATLGMFALLFAGTFLLIRCGGTSTTTGMGSAYVTISDPPSNTDFSHVWVTIDDISANISSTSDTGWQSLDSLLDPSGNPVQAVQVDLMNLPAQGQCLLAQLGSTQSLPAGDYQQIRLMLVANNATNVNLNAPSNGEPTSNQCSSVNAWNCVVTGSGTSAVTTALDLSSEAQTGIKIPSGQVIGGPIHVASGQSVDINIDFASDRSIVAEGNGQYRLDPVLVAYQSGNSSQGASANLTGISGQVVSGTISGTTVANGTPISGAQVAIEYTSSSGSPITSISDGKSTADLIGNYLTSTDQNGNFDVCPLPPGTMFNVVADAGPTSTSPTATTYNATVITGVPNGTQLVDVTNGPQLAVPLLQEPTPATPGTIAGSVTGDTSTTATFDADLYAMQMATTSLEFSVPLLYDSNSGPDSEPLMAQTSVTCSTSSNCTPTSFSLAVPASNPLVGAFSSGSVTWAAPSTTTPVKYRVAAVCASPGTGSTPQFGAAKVTADATAITTPSPLAFTLTDCQ
jgi:hypothetical protein